MNLSLIEIQKKAREEYKDISHKRSADDVRGSCGYPCHQCSLDEKTSIFFESITTTAFAAGREEGIRDEATKTKNGASRYLLGFADGEKARSEELIKYIEKLIQQERFSGAPYALNQVIDLIKKDL